MLKIYVLTPCHGCTTFLKSSVLRVGVKTLHNRIKKLQHITHSKFVVSKPNGVNPTKLLKFKISVLS